MWNDKSDGYLIPARSLTGTGMNFYLWVRVQISTRSLFADGRVITLSDPLPSLSMSERMTWNQRGKWKYTILKNFPYTCILSRTPD
jgi:hypothetical protein